MIKVNILKFKKNQFTDITNYKEDLYNVIQCGSRKYTMRDFKFVNPNSKEFIYTSVLYLNGKPLCKCEGNNDNITIIPLSIANKALIASTMVFLGDFGYSINGEEYRLELENVADILSFAASKIA